MVALAVVEVVRISPRSITPSWFVLSRLWPASSRGTGVVGCRLRAGVHWHDLRLCAEPHTRYAGRVLFPRRGPYVPGVTSMRRTPSGRPLPRRGSSSLRCCRAGRVVEIRRRGVVELAGVEVVAERVELAGWLPSACGVIDAGTLACRRGGARVWVRVWVRVWSRRVAGAEPSGDGVACTGRVACGRCGACESPG